MLPGIKYTVTVTTNVEDVAGNALNSIDNIGAAPQAWTFKTAGATDVTAPTVASVFPTDGSTNVPVNEIISVTFSEAMNSSTITTGNITFSPTVTGNWTYNAGTLTASFTPSTNMSTNTLYTVTVGTAVQDAAGNSIAVPEVWSFTTVP